MKALNATAHKILDEAEHHTQTRGFNDFSYKDIQASLGIKTSSIHYYFPSKQDLAVAMTERYVTRFMEGLNEVAQRHDRGQDRLSALVDVYGSVLAEDKFCLCGMMASDAHGLPDSVTDLLTTFFKQLEQWVGDAIADIAPDAAESDAAWVVSALEGAMLIARHQGGSHQFKSVMSAALAKLTG